jgi:hypothetical protein
MPSEAIAIYRPSTDTWPYIVLVRHGSHYETFIAQTHEEARKLAVTKRGSRKQATVVEPSPTFRSPVSNGGAVLESSHA